MKRVLLSALVTVGLVSSHLSLASVNNASNTVERGLVSGIDLSNMDKTVRAQDDFYRHMNGLWLKTFKMPAEKSNYGAFTQLAEQSREDVKAIIDDVSNAANPAGSAEEKIAFLYKTYMATDAIEAKGLSAIRDELDRINAIKDKESLSEYMGYADIYNTAPIGMYVYIDQKKSDEHIVYVAQSGLGLPDRDYYMKDDEKSEKIQRAYTEHIGNILKLAAVDNAEAKAERIYALERSLAQGQWTRIENRDSEKTYNKMAFDDLMGRVPSINWDAWLRHTMIEKPTYVVVNQPSYLDTLDTVIANTSIQSWKDYYTFHAISNAASSLSREFDQENFAFYGTVLSGTTEQEPRWKRGVDLINGIVGELVGKVYVKRHFPAEAKRRMVTMIENLRSAYRDSIKNLEWMSSETKIKALEKLAKFDPKVGYPDVWRDYSKMNIRDESLIENMKEATRFLTLRNRSKLGQPIDRTEWGMNPQTVNAYYNPTKNEIVFPAAILQPPFFNLAADEAVNYGGIGAVIGHEMGHGFDDQGAKYDGDGNLKNWWTEEDLKQFKQRTSKLVKQYDAFTVVDGTHVKGEFTQGENIGDLSGLSIAYKAYKATNPDNTVIDGYTSDQRFFMGWAQVWMRKYRDEELLRRIDTDPHSPSEFRANGILRNLPEFYEAFGVKQGDGMYLAPEDRVKIW